jgi:hypothetical protein
VARPTDPVKLAELRARQAANSRAYRARKAAERAAEPPGTPGNRGNEPAPRRRAQPSSEDAVRAAHDQKAAAAARRNEAIGGRYEIIDGKPTRIGGLTSARNPAVKIHVPFQPDRAPAAMPDTAAKRRARIKAIRDRTAAEKLENIGRARKAHYSDILANDPRADQIRKNLNAEQLARVNAVSKRIKKASQQTLAIYLTYEGGEGELQAALQQLSYPGSDGGDIEDNLSRLENIADTLDRAESLYGPKAAGRLRI